MNKTAETQNVSYNVVQLRPTGSKYSEKGSNSQEPTNSENSYHTLDYERIKKIL